MVLTVCSLTLLYAKFQIKLMVQSGRKLQLKIFTLQFLLHSFAKSCMTIARAHLEISSTVETDPILNNHLTQIMLA